MEQRITGWAVDRAAANGPGIEAVRVALDPAGSGDDALYSPVQYGVTRPDVAYALGNARYLDSGFVREWGTLAATPGRHRLVIQAKSADFVASIGREGNAAPRAKNGNGACNHFVGLRSRPIDELCHDPFT